MVENTTENKKEFKKDLKKATAACLVIVLVGTVCTFLSVYFFRPGFFGLVIGVFFGFLGSFIFFAYYIIFVY